MAKLFYLSEILKFAIEKEQQSSLLYHNLADKLNKPEVKELFQKLAQEELKHKEFYSKMLEGIEKEQSPGVKEDAEYNIYMKTLIATSRTIPLPSSPVLRDTSKILDYAIDREKDSVLFYSGLKNFVPSSAHANIDRIINEEVKHAAILMEMKGNL